MRKATPATTPFVFTVSLSNAFNQTVTVQYNTATPAAATRPRAGVDYQATSGTLTFTPGHDVASRHRAGQRRHLVEPDEIFNLVLSNPDQRHAGRQQHRDGHDPQRRFRVVADDRRRASDQCHLGTTNAVFTVTLSPVGRHR